MIEILLDLLPAAALALALIFGRYPGRRLLLRLAETSRRVGVPPPRSHRPRSLPQRLARGGELLASRLAGRAPPGFASPHA